MDIGDILANGVYQPLLPESSGKKEEVNRHRDVESSQSTRSSSTSNSSLVGVRLSRTDKTMDINNTLANGVCQPLLPESREKEHEAIRHLDVESSPSTRSLSLQSYHSFSQLTLFICGRIIQLLLVATAIVLLSFTLNALPIQVNSPYRWRFSLAAAMATSALCLLQILALMIRAAKTWKLPQEDDKDGTEGQDRSSSRHHLLPLLLVVSSMVFDVFCCFLLFGAAIAIIPDAVGGAIPFDEEMHKLGPNGQESPKELQEDGCFFDAYQRSRRGTIAAMLFTVSYTNICLLGYILYTHFELRV